MSELEFITNPHDAAVDIVFVHGWKNENHQPWNYGPKGNSIFWPRALLPKKIPKARILAFAYDADIGHFVAVQSESRLDSVSDDLFRRLRDKRTESKTTDRPIVFVTHSIGGLVCENVGHKHPPFGADLKRLTKNPQGLVRAHDSSNAENIELTRHVRAIAFLGTPFHWGEEYRWAETAAKFWKLCKGPHPPPPTDSIQETSAKLAALEKKFKELWMLRSNIENDDGLYVESFYEGSTTELPSGENIAIVTAAAADFPGCSEPRIIIHSDHQAMCGFKDEDDINYKVVAKQLAEWADELRGEKRAWNRDWFESRFRTGDIAGTMVIKEGLELKSKFEAKLAGSPSK